MTIKDIFDNLNLECIQEYIDKRQEENLHLEFKTVNNSELSHQDDKKNFSKALSGFANSSGGIIVWGIVARKNEEKIDCASDKQHIDNISLFMSKLNEYTGIAVTPIVNAVEHKAIYSGKNCGFAATLVPESEIGPHMAKFKEDRYYKRSGDSFYKMEHYDITDMFGRRRTPKLIVYYKIIPGGNISSGGKTTHEYGITFGIKNEGRDSAHFLYFAIEKVKNFANSQPLNPTIYELSSFYEPNWTRIAGKNDLILHPGMFIDIFSIRSKFKEDFIDIHDITINYEIAANDVMLAKSTLKISRDEILEYYSNLKS